MCRWEEAFFWRGSVWFIVTCLCGHLLVLCVLREIMIAWANAFCHLTANKSVIYVHRQSRLMVQPFKAHRMLWWRKLLSRSFAVLANHFSPFSYFLSDQTLKILKIVGICVGALSLLCTIVAGSCRYCNRRHNQSQPENVLAMQGTVNAGTDGEGIRNQTGSSWKPAQWSL